MNCNNCNTPNEEGAKFCVGCGAPLSHPERKASDKSGMLIVVFLATIFMEALLEMILPFVFSAFDEPMYVAGTIGFYVYIILSTIFTFVWLLLPFAVKKLSLRIVSFAIVAVYMAVRLFRLVRMILQITEYSSGW